MTAAQREAQAVSSYLSRNGLVVDNGYGNGQFYIRVPIPAPARNRRKTVLLQVRRPVRAA